MLPVALALANAGTISAPEAALAVMLSISMVGSLAKLEVFSENMRQVKFTVDGEPLDLSGFLGSEEAEAQAEEDESVAAAAAAAAVADNLTSDDGTDAE